jgi:hypothetical protein
MKPQPKTGETMTYHKSPQELARELGIEYLDAIPAPATIPAAKVVVHNSVRPTRRLGSNGFRAWLSPPTRRVVACDCGWAPELGVHYRVDRDRSLAEAEKNAWRGGQALEGGRS